MSDGDWKQAHANLAEQAIDHPLVVGVMEEFAANMRFELKGLPAYGLAKVALYAAQVARAQCLGFDPELLRLTPDEGNAAMMRLAAEAVLTGFPVHAIDVPGMSDDPEENR